MSLTNEDILHRNFCVNLRFSQRSFFEPVWPAGRHVVKLSEKEQNLFRAVNSFQFP